MARKRQSTMPKDLKQNGFTCKLEVVLKEPHDRELGNLLDQSQ